MKRVMNLVLASGGCGISWWHCGLKTWQLKRPRVIALVVVVVICSLQSSAMNFEEIFMQSQYRARCQWSQSS